MPWDNQSRRRSQLPPNWAALRLACAEAAGWQCQATTQQGLRCTHPGNEAHHPHPDNHTHLIWLCPFHHNIETQKQARAARTYVTQARPKEPHPGLRPTPTPTPQGHAVTETAPKPNRYNTPNEPDF